MSQSTMFSECCLCFANVLFQVVSDNYVLHLTLLVSSSKAPGRYEEYRLDEYRFV